MLTGFYIDFLQSFGKERTDALMFYLNDSVSGEIQWLLFARNQCHFWDRTLITSPRWHWPSWILCLLSHASSHTTQCSTLLFCLFTILEMKRAFLILHCNSTFKIHKLIGNQIDIYVLYMCMYMYMCVCVYLYSFLICYY